MAASDWLSNNWIEIFGAIAGIIYVFLEIRQNLWLWPLGIITSGVYIWVFFTSKLYADMSLQGYYLLISCLGWYWWIKGARHRAQGKEQNRGKKRRVGEEERSDFARTSSDEVEKQRLQVTRLKLRTGIMLAIVFIILYTIMWFILSRWTDSPVPEWDSFLTSLSIIATWMLARKIYEHWYLWIVVNSVSVILYFTRGLYPTVILYIIYCIMSFAGLAAWKDSIHNNQCDYKKQI